MKLKWLIVCALLLLTPAGADAKDYSVRRYDVAIRVLERGTLEVTETAVFQFEDGTFTFVTREIPSRRTDGIEILSASMDGREMSFGDEAGQVEVTAKSRVRARWRFTPVAQSTHTFVLKYLAHGVVHREEGADLLAWTALPRQHSYRIASSTIDLDLPAAPIGEPAITVRRGQEGAVERAAERLRITAHDLRSNGSVELRVRFPEGAVIAVPPEWQARQIRANERGPRWLIAGGVAFAVCFVLLFALRQNYDAPTRDLAAPTIAVSKPDDLPPAVAGTLGANGSTRPEHAMAALISLADRGEVTIAAEPRGFLGQRDFTITRPRGSAPLASYEQALIDTVFRGRDDAPKESVKLSTAGSRLAFRIGRFAKAMQQHLREQGLLDEARKAVRDRYAHVAVMLFVLGTAGFVGAAVFLVREHGPWAFAVSGAFIAAAIVALMFHAATTPLSNEGLRRAQSWRAFRRYLRSVARERTQLAGDAAARLLPWAIALGLGSVWAKYAEHVPAVVPAWFLAATSDARAYPVFIATAGAGAHGGAGGAGGAGAAGGGSSGAG